MPHIKWRCSRDQYSSASGSFKLFGMLESNDAYQPMEINARHCISQDIQVLRRLCTMFLRQIPALALSKHGSQLAGLKSSSQVVQNCMASLQKRLNLCSMPPLFKFQCAYA